MRGFERSKRGFTLVELMIVVAIIGVLAALAIFGVRKYLANAKSSEAKNTVGTINRSAVAAYNRETSSSEILSGGASGTQAAHSLCGTATPVPNAVPANRKYQPKTANGQDFLQGDPANGWTCLRFTMTEPIYYQYAYTSGSTVAIATGLTLAGAGWLAEAAGDLDGDGIKSAFLTGGAIVNGEPVKATELTEKDAEE